MDPLETILKHLVPALAAGNVVILKISEWAPRSGDLLAQVIQDLVHSKAWPAALVQVLQGKGESVGQALVVHPGLHTLSLTGQPETGRQLLRDAAEGLKRTHLSLGSRNPVLLFQETNLGDVLPKIIRICMRQTGCTRGSRIFVQEAIYKEFLAQFKSSLENLKLGDPLAETSDIGPVPSKFKQEKFNETVRLALSERAKLLNDETSALPANGFYVQPRALFDLTYCSTIQQEEIVGPLVTITSFKYQHDAIKNANNSPFGLIGYVFCDDPEKARKIAEKLDVSRVILNGDRDLDDQMTPQGGLRQSGLGSLGFGELFRFYSRETAVFGA